MLNCKNALLLSQQILYWKQSASSIDCRLQQIFSYTKQDLIGIETIKDV